MLWSVVVFDELSVRPSFSSRQNMRLSETPNSSIGFIRFRCCSAASHAYHLSSSSIREIRIRPHDAPRAAAVVVTSSSSVTPLPTLPDSVSKYNNDACAVRAYAMICGGVDWVHVLRYGIRQTPPWMHHNRNNIIISKREYLLYYLHRSGHRGTKVCMWKQLGEYEAFGWWFLNNNLW